MRKLRYLRFLRSFSLDELASKTGLSASKLSRYERGFAHLGDHEKEVIAKALKVKKEVIFSED